MKGVEIDFIVKDSLLALKQYEQIFSVRPIEATDFPKGQNEVVFEIDGTRFHMLDENPDFQMFAPVKNQAMPIWFNVVVPEIKAVHEAALLAGCREIQAVTVMKDCGVSNSMFTDSFGYLWMLHQIHQKVSFEDRVKAWEDKSNI